VCEIEGRTFGGLEKPGRRGGERGTIGNESSGRGENVKSARGGGGLKTVGGLEQPRELEAQDPHQCLRSNLMVKVGIERQQVMSP